MMERNDPIPALELSNTVAHGSHDAGGFVAVDAGGSQQIVLNLFQVGVTNSAGFDANQDLAGADGWRWDLFNANLAAAAINGGVHGFRYDESVRIGSRQ